MGRFQTSLFLFCYAFVCISSTKAINRYSDGTGLTLKHNTDTSKYITNSIYVGFLGIAPGYTNSIPGLGFSYDFLEPNTKWYSVMHNSYGYIVRNEMMLNLKENPFSPSTDISYGLGAFNLMVYDKDYNPISRSWIKKVSMLNIGLGGEVSGKILRFGIKYRIGYISSGLHPADLPTTPAIISNHKMNTINNLYQGIDIHFGAKYKRFSAIIHRGFALNRNINLGNGLYTGMSSMSVEFGYSFLLTKI